VGLQLGGGYCLGWAGLGRGLRSTGRQAARRVARVCVTRFTRVTGSEGGDQGIYRGQYCV
jgi:hypothetical protein